MANDEKNFLPIFQILHIKNEWFLLELEMALVTTIEMRFVLVCAASSSSLNYGYQHTYLEVLYFLSRMAVSVWMHWQRDCDTYLIDIQERTDKDPTSVAENGMTFPWYLKDFF